MTLLSHYTSRVGLEGIARSKSIRATKFSQLNDKREIEYGYVEFIRRALLGVFGELDKIMPRKAGVTLDLADGERRLVEQFRTSFEGDKGSEHLYVASFAKGKTEDHDNRGMLTLWDRYTKLEGYCLQFHEVDVRRIIDLEAGRRNYAFLTLDNVHYGMDEGTSEYQDLAFQMKQLLLIEVLKECLPFRYNQPMNKCGRLPSHHICKLYHAKQACISAMRGMGQPMDWLQFSAAVIDHLV